MKDSYERDELAKNYTRIGCFAAIPSVVVRALHVDEYMSETMYTVLNVIFLILIVVVAIFMHKKRENITEKYYRLYNAVIGLLGLEGLWIGYEIVQFFIAKQ